MCHIEGHLQYPSLPPSPLSPSLSLLSSRSVGLIRPTVTFDPSLSPNADFTILHIDSPGPTSVPKLACLHTERERQRPSHLTIGLLLLR